jgi:hypothetical protein
LSFDDFIDMLRVESLLSEMIDGNCITNLTRMNLFDTRLVLETLSVALNMIWSPWGILVTILISLHTVLSTFIRSKDNMLSSGSNVRSDIEFAS